MALSEPTLDPWLASEEDEEERESQWDLLKEELIGEIRVVMRKDEKRKNIEVRAYHVHGNQLDLGRGWAQYLPTWKNERIDGPAQAEEYFQGLVAWFKGGRNGRILPFKYRGDP